ncbi:MAG: Rieske (2Fe-2S) protein [Gemmatimonadaceae bacterium]|nr:Rieske (2Fe-2S) protein [Gemmatimonadaceae bacterium]NUQ92512.1 Rieske (2Fe-2S) protein [Gemmatimonadaceae bacterium]NUR32401.1 Rieske (2Fe-2S) protein [Gemmatimonadaceae bacterium]
MSTANDCGACPVAEMGRRAFLRNAALAAAATMAAIGLAPGSAFAEAVRAVTPLSAAGAGGTDRVYRIPSADSVSIDRGNDVILVRWQGVAYAFSLKCPHRGTRLEWHADESRVFCPKHKARFRPDGAHDSGRRTRNLDRYAIRREGATLVVALDRVYRADADAAAWTGATVSVD